MRRSKMLGAITMVAAVIVLAGCSSTAGSALGTWGHPGAPGKPFLELKSGDHLAGSDGCNRLTGSWTQKGSTITFGPMASTMMACPGVVTWLTKASTATVSGSTMTVEGSSKQKLGTLTRQ